MRLEHYHMVMMIQVVSIDRLKEKACYESHIKIKTNKNIRKDILRNIRKIEMTETDIETTNEKHIGTMTEKDTGTMIDSKHRHQRGYLLPTHLQAQQDAVVMVALAKLRSDPESNVGQVSQGSLEILLTYHEEKGTFEHNTSDNKLSKHLKLPIIEGKTDG